MSLADNDLSPAAEAYVWGFPLVSVHRTRLMLCSRVDSGSMNHIDDLATPKDRGIVVPNNDTLYSSAWYDLRSWRFGDSGAADGSPTAVLECHDFRWVHPRRLCVSAASRHPGHRGASHLGSESAASE